MSEITPINRWQLPQEVIKTLDEGFLNLKGKHYLQVAHRVLWFRCVFPDWTIATEAVTVADIPHIRATIGFNNDGEFVTVATAHKRILEIGEKSGPAGQNPVETAETGAIGRALGLCGFGTLGGSLTEEDQLADAPQKLTNEQIKSKF